jgi:hypothetical protein
MFDDYRNENRYCEVEQDGDIDRETNSTKVCSSKITIKAEIGLKGLIQAGIEWIKEVTKVGRLDDTSSLNDKGYSAQIGSIDYAKIGSSGDYAKVGSSGDSAKIGSSGDYAKINSTGEDAVICCAGNGSMVKAKLGSWITLAEWMYSESKERNVPIMVKTIKIDGETYKPDTWYAMRNSEILEAK